MQIEQLPDHIHCFKQDRSQPDGYSSLPLSLHDVTESVHLCMNSAGYEACQLQQYAFA